MNQNPPLINSGRIGSNAYTSGASGTFGTAPVYTSGIRTNPNVITTGGVPYSNRDNIIPTSYDRASHGYVGTSNLPIATTPIITTGTTVTPSVMAVNPLPPTNSAIRPLPVAASRIDTHSNLQPQKPSAFSPSCCCWALLGLLGLVGLILGILFGVGVLGRSGADIKSISASANANTPYIAPQGIRQNINPNHINIPTVQNNVQPIIQQNVVTPIQNTYANAQNAVNGWQLPSQYRHSLTKN